MPFTPLHMGPGMAVKAIAGRHFSLAMFGVAQIAMDIEPLVGIIRGSPQLHGWSHTYLGATLIGAAVLVARGPCSHLVRWWNAELARHRLDWLASGDGIAWGPAVAGAFVGTWSHVALDSIMHLDMAPGRPFADGNPLLLAIGIDTLHVACLAAGVAGLLLWTLRAYLRRRL